MTEFNHNKDAGTVKLRLVRAFEGIFFSIGAVYFLILNPTLRDTPLGKLGNWHLLPVAVAVFATFQIPLLPQKSAKPRRFIFERLRLSALCCLGLGPFMSWWLRSEGNLYLAICAGMALIACCWYHMELLSMAQIIAENAGNRPLELKASWLRGIILYVSIVPICSIYTTFTIGYLTIPGVDLLDLERLWRLIPAFFNFLMFLPFFLALLFLWRLRQSLQVLPDEVYEDMNCRVF